jgi:hypothetical protein
MTNSYEHVAEEKNIIESAEFFPAVVDNFFSEPDIIRKWVNDLPMQKTLEGQWPGYRSPALHTIDSHFSNTLILKALSTYFNLRYENFTWEDSNVSFSVIEPYDTNKDSSKNKGWVHIDTNSDVAGVIYLTPNADLNSGTSLYQPKPEFEKDISFFKQYEEKKAFYGDGKISDKDYITAIENFNNKFTETVNVKNVYNRMIIYDSRIFHKANNFITGDTNRLTLVFFVKGLKIDKKPLSKIRDKENFDNSLLLRIKHFYENTKSENRN